jgi:hypothetical protein
MLDWTGWLNPWAVAYILVMIGTIILIWLIPKEFINE